MMIEWVGFKANDKDQVPLAQQLKHKRPNYTVN